MGRIRLFPLMISLVFLAACGGNTAERSTETHATELQRQWREMTACSCRLALTADYGQRVFSCELDAAYDQVTGGTLTVIEPELLRGVSARIAPEGLTLNYDGTSLETGPLTDEGLSPLEAAPTLFRLVARGNLAAWAEDDGVLHLTFRDFGAEPGLGLEAAVTFDAETDVPLEGRLSWNGAEILRLQISNFQMMTGENPEGS